MAAWIHRNKWNDHFYEKYRAATALAVPGDRGTKDVDCADLSIKSLIYFAADNGLPVTFLDVSGFMYCSLAPIPWGMLHRSRATPWFDKERFLGVVRNFIQTKSLYKHNTVENPSGPQPGDLMMRYKKHWYGSVNQGMTHTALVFGAYTPGTPSPMEKNVAIPDFPGDGEARKQFNQTQYFRGTVNDDEVTKSRLPDRDAHFDYLNSRSDNKRNAELIYFANAKQFTDDDFEFRMYAPRVLDNWEDWTDTAGPPPRGLGMRSYNGLQNEPNDEDTPSVQQVISDS